MINTANDFKTDFDGLKRLGKEFLDALPTSNIDEADNGLKCFQLAYLNGNFSDVEQHQAELLLHIVSKQFIIHEAKLVGDE